MFFYECLILTICTLAHSLHIFTTIRGCPIPTRFQGPNSHQLILHIRGILHITSCGKATVFLSHTLLWITAAPYTATNVGAHGMKIKKE